MLFMTNSRWNGRSQLGNKLSQRLFWLLGLLFVSAFFARAGQVSGSYCPAGFPADFQCDVCEADSDCSAERESGVCTSDMVVQPLSQELAWSCNVTGSNGLLSSQISGIYLSCILPQATCSTRLAVFEDILACTLTNCYFTSNAASGTCSTSICACNPGPCKDALVAGITLSSGRFDWQCGAPSSCSFNMVGVPLMPLLGNCTSGQCVRSPSPSDAGGRDGGGGVTSAGGASTGAVVGGVVGGVVGLLVLAGLLVGWRGLSRLQKTGEARQEGSGGKGRMLDSPEDEGGNWWEVKGVQLEAGCEATRGWEPPPPNNAPGGYQEQLQVAVPPNRCQVQLKNWRGAGGGRQSSTSSSTEPGMSGSAPSWAHLGAGAQHGGGDGQGQEGDGGPSMFPLGDGAARSGGERAGVPTFWEDVELQLAIRAAEVARGRGGDAGVEIDNNTWTVDFQDLELQAKIGEGSYGRVYLARWQQALVAVKVLLNAGVDVHSPQALQQAVTLSSPVLANLRKEAGLLATLRHPNVVGFLGVCAVPPCIVMEYCANGSLTSVLQAAKVSPEATGQLCWHRRLNMLLDTARGMLYLHSLKAPIIHRDLKSPNLLVDEHWRVKVSDFNLSRILGDAAALSSAQATNPRWQATEVLQGQPATLLSDVYSFGVVMWEMLTWQLPFATDNHWQIMRFVVEGGWLSVPPLDQLPGRDTPQFSGLGDYIQLMRSCWAQVPQDRPTFTQIIEALRGLVEQTTAGLQPDPKEQAHLGFERTAKAPSRPGTPPSPWASPSSHVPLPAGGGVAGDLPWPRSSSEASIVGPKSHSGSIS